MSYHFEMFFGKFSGTVWECSNGLIYLILSLFLYQGSRGTYLKIFYVLDMTTSQIDAENTQMTNDLYRLLKKYSGLRNLIRQLKVSLLDIMFQFIDVIIRSAGFILYTRITYHLNE